MFVLKLNSGCIFYHFDKACQAPKIPLPTQVETTNKYSIMIKQFWIALIIMVVLDLVLFCGGLYLIAFVLFGLAFIPELLREKKYK